MSQTDFGSSKGQSPLAHRHILIEVYLVKLQAVAQKVVHHTRQQSHLWEREDVHELLDGRALGRESTLSHHPKD